MIQVLAKLWSKSQDEATFKQLMEQEIVISDYIRYTKQPAVKKDLQKDYMFAEVWEYVTTGKKTAKIQHLINTHKLLQKLEFWCQFKRRGNNQTIHIYEKYVPC